MSPAQRREYWSVLWPAACQAKGWDAQPEDVQDRLRRALTLEASNNATNSITQLDEDQITVLWNLLKHYAAPLNLNAAKGAANPREVTADNKRRQYIYRINQLGFSFGYIQKVAAWDCREAQVSKWTRLPVELNGRGSAGLRRVLIHLTQRANGKKNRMTVPPPVRQAPLHFPPVNAAVEYQMKPAKIFTPVQRRTSDNPY